MIWYLLLPSFITTIKLSYELVKEFDTKFSPDYNSRLNLFSPSWYFTTNLTLDTNVYWSGDLINLNLPTSLDQFQSHYRKMYPPLQSDPSIFPFKDRKAGFYLQDPVAITRPFLCYKNGLCSLESIWSNRTWSYDFHPHPPSSPPYQPHPTSHNFTFIGPSSFFLWRRDLHWAILDQRYYRDTSLIARELLLETKLQTIPLTYPSGLTITIFGIAPVDHYHQIKTKLK